MQFETFFFFSAHLDVFSKRFSTFETGFLFLKPSANNHAVLALVGEVLHQHGVRIVANEKLTGSELAFRKVLDSQYGLAEQFAHSVRTEDLVLSAEELRNFRSVFSAPWTQAVHHGKVLNAAEACEHLHIDGFALSDLWHRAEFRHRIRRGLYVSCLTSECSEDPSVRKKLKYPLYVVNGFFDALRESYCAKRACVHYLVVEWDGAHLSWGRLQKTVIGDCDPNLAAPSSIRGRLFSDWQTLLLYTQPTRTDNCVHMSGSALQGLAERLVWIKGSMLFTDLFGSRLLAARFKSNIIKEWLADPLLNEDGSERLFDRLEGLNSLECLELLTNMLNQKA